MKTSPNTIRFSIGISTFAMAMVLLSSILIVVFYYMQDTQRAETRTARNISETVRQVEARVRVLTSAMRLTLDNMVSVSALIGDRENTSASLQVILPPILTRNPAITSAYLGFEDDDFIQVVPLAGRGPAVRKLYRAAPEAVFAIVEVSDNAAGSRTRTVRSVDGRGRAVGRRWSEPTTFRPSERPWYGVGGLTAANTYFRSPPYVYAASHQPGITLSRRLSASDPGTAGVDLDLQSLKEFLISLKLTRTARLAIISPDNRLLGHTQIDPVDVRAKSGGSVSLTLRSLDAALDPVLAGLAAMPDLGRDPTDFMVDGRRYFGSVIPVELGGNEADRLLIAVPWDEIAQPLNEARNRALLVMLGLALFVLIVAVFVGRWLARPIEKLTADAEAIGMLEFSSGAAVRSPFSEVHQLSMAMQTMKSAIAVFSRYVPRSLVANLVESGTGGELGGVRRDIALMFTDIKDFTTISEKSDSMAMMRQLSDYFECLSTSILAHNGTIDKYIGDAVMAFWNAPRDDLEMASNACKAALRAQNGLQTLNIKWDIEGRDPFITRFGLHVGNAIVGNVGSSDRMNYTAMGAPVNVAARLEGLNKAFGTTILASDAVRRRTGSAFVWRTIGLVNPKGVSTPIMVHELIGLNASQPDVADLNPVSPAERARVDEWNRIFDAFLEKRWTESADWIAEYLTRFSDDGVARFYLERSRDYCQTPPPADWAGAEEFLSK
ncbi:MAG: adenylate/guanylate cyclase domain-containing protein [Pseudomonadota bacterium]